MSHEETNGQTVASLKRVKDMFQVNLPAKYAIPAILSLLGLSGYAYRDALIPATVSTAWVRGVDKHIEDSKGGYDQLHAQGEAIAEMQREQVANRVAIENLTHSMEKLTERIDRILERDSERR